LPQPFGSPARAQRWYFSYGPAGCAFSLIYLYQLGFLAFVLGFSRHLSDIINPHLVVFGFVVCLPILVMGLVVPVHLILRALGVRLRKLDPRQLPGGQLEPATFLRLRPMSGGEFAAAILRASLRNVLTNCRWWLSLALVLGIGWSVAHAAGRAVHDWTRPFGDLSAWQCIGVIVLSAVAVVVVLWHLTTNWMMVLPGSNRLWRQTALFTGFVGVNGLAAVGLSLLLDPTTRARAVGVFTGLGLAILVLKVVVASAAFLSARRAGLVEAPAVRDLCRCWLAVAVPALASAAVLLPAKLPVPVGFVVLWMVIFLPLGRLPLIAFAFESGRHR
jgi:hypothetical protein